MLPEAWPFLKRICPFTLVSVQNAHKEAMATTAVRNVATAAVLPTRATLSTEHVLVLPTSGNHRCVTVRNACRMNKMIEC